MDDSHFASRSATSAPMQRISMQSGRCCNPWFWHEARMILMARVLALLLAALFGMELVAPAVLADDPTLPACCRRNGAHRCSMLSGPSDGPAVQAPECP